MKRIYFAVFASSLLVLGVAAQTQAGAQANAQAGAQAGTQANVGDKKAQASGGASTAASAQSNGSRAMIANGTAINATLNSSIDSKKAKQGEEVTAHTTEAIKSEGKTVVPKGCRLVGHVTRASARGKGDADSMLGIAFDKAILKNGEEIPLNGSIQALASAQSAATVAGSDVDSMAGAGASGGGRTMSSGRGGALGGVASTAGGAVGGVTNTAGNVASTAGGTVDATTRAAAGTAGATSGAVGGLTATGQFATNSRGVFGMNGLNLNTAGSNSAEGSVITSAGKNVHLDGGTRMLIVTGAQAGEAKPAPEGAQKPEPNSKKQTNQ